MTYSLRPYQQECLAKIDEAFVDFKRVLIVLGTGLGKTILFNELAKKYIDNGQRVLVLAHREELLEQAAEKMFRFHKIEHTLIKSGETTDISKMFYIGSVQSLCKEKRLNEFPKDYFGLTILDESHHGDNKTYKIILDYFDSANLLGVTATPAEQKSLSKVFETTAFEYNMEQGIADGWLSPIIARMANVEIDISEVRTVAGDFVVSELDDVVTKQFKKISRYIKANLELRKRILIFTPRIISAEILAEVLKIDGLNAEFVCGASKDRKEKTERFKNGDIKIMCNSLLYTEGFDLPEIDCIINLRPTQSMTLWKQMMGRGTRTAPGKDNLLLVDFLWKTEKEIINPCSLFSKDISVSTSMKDFLIHNVNNSFDLSELESYIDMIMGGMAKMESARRKTISELPLRGLKSYETFAFLVNNKAILEYEPIYEWQKKPVSKRQGDFLELKCGISCKKVNMGLANLIIDDIIKRIENKLCSIKQMLFLSKNGMFDSVSNMKMTVASDIMDKTSKNYWKVPFYLQKQFCSDKRLKTPLLDIKKLKIEPVKEGQKEWAKKI